MRHLMGVVVQSNDGFSLLYAGQYDHQGSVCYHQVQVVFGQVKVYRLKKKRNQVRFYLNAFFPLRKSMSDMST